MATPPPLASVSDLADWLDENLTLGSPRAEAYMRAASSFVRRYTGRTWLDDDGDLTDVPEDVWTVTLQVAERKWRNPEGFVQDTTGPFTVRYSEQTAQGMYFTDAELEMLDPHRSNKRPALWTQRLSGQDPYLDVLVQDMPNLGMAAGEL